MSLAPIPWGYLRIAATILAAMTSSGGAAEPDYAQAITALKHAGAMVGPSDEAPRPSERRKSVTKVVFIIDTDEEADAAIRSLHNLRGLPHPEDVRLVFSGFPASLPRKLLQESPRFTEALSRLKGFCINTAVDSSHVTDAAICELSKTSQISELVITSLDSVELTDKGLACLKELRLLRALVLNHTRITDDGLVYLSGMKRLERLSLADTEIDGHGLRHLQDVPLRFLVLTGSDVNDENLKGLSKLERLEHLVLGGCPINGSGLKHLSRMGELRVLSLSGTRVDEAGLRQLQRLRGLRELFLTECATVTDECIPALAKLTRLEQLNIDETKISSAGRKKLAVALPGTHIE